jgi:hypothetical protein
LRDIVQKQQVLFRTLQKLSKPITNTRVKSGKHGTSTLSLVQNRVRLKQ